MVALENGDLDEEQEKLILDLIDTNRENPLVLQAFEELSMNILEIDWGSFHFLIENSYQFL